MTHTSTEQERAEFEAWFNETNGSGSGEVHGAAWEAWQESAARRAQVVPVQPTSKQVVLGAAAILGQPEGTADNRDPNWKQAVEQAERAYLAMLAAAPQPPEAACNPSMQPELATFARPTDIVDLIAGECQTSRANAYELMEEALKSRHHIPGAGQMVAAPVQMPKPFGWIDDGGLVYWRLGKPPADDTNIYTEHQVRQLLAAHGIAKN